MKLRGLYAMLLSLLVGVVSIMAGGFCLAQMVPQPPFMVPYTPGMTSGLFYFNGGVKFRNIQTVAFKIVPHAVSQVASLGTVPWGPEVEGSVFYPYDAAAVPPLPTGNPAEDPDRSGIWEYDDGIIDPRASTDVCAQNPIAFTSVGGNRALGHRAAPENNIGRFTVAVPSTQTDNRGGTYQGTTHITFSRRIDGRTAFEIASRIFQVSFDTDRQLEFTHKIWTPYLELGYRASSFFDVLFGVSWFTLSDTSLTRAHSYAYLHRRIFNDTFRFVGDDTQSWPALGFSSVVTHGAPPVGCTVSTNPVATQNYALYPAGTGGGRDLPTRVFTFGVDPTVPPIMVEELLYNRIDLTAIEFKSGGRSWFPLYGAGEVGSSLGLLWSPMPVTIVTRSQVVAREDSVPMGVVAGQTIIDSAHKEQEVWLWRNIGLFVGVDLRLNSGRFFAQSNIEYDLYPIENQYGEMVVNRVNISGVNANFTGGVTF